MMKDPTLRCDSNSTASTCTSQSSDASDHRKVQTSSSTPNPPRRGKKSQKTKSQRLVAKEEKENTAFAAKVGIYFSSYGGDYLIPIQLTGDGSDESSNDIIFSSPQYGKKDDHKTFREMFGEVDQILDIENSANENVVNLEQQSHLLITPRTRKIMIDHDQEMKLRKYAALLSKDWANKEFIAPTLARRLRDFEFAQMKRRVKTGEGSKYGVLGLYDFLSGVRTDVEWADYVAYRRAQGLAYVPWSHFVAKKKGGLNQPFFTYIIIALCTFTLVLSIGLNGWAFEAMRTNPSLGPSAQTLVTLGAKDTNLIVNELQVWRIFTPMFLHGGIIHFVLNFLALLYVGRAVEESHGFLMTMILFCVSGVGATLVSAVFLPQYVTVGASGGIFGLMGACIADILKNWRILFSDFINQGKRKRHHVLIVIILFLDIILNLLIGLTPFTDNFMHLGGIFFGFLSALSMLNLVDLFGFEKEKLVVNFSSRYFGLIFSLVLMIVTTVILFSGDGKTTPCESCGVLSCVSFPPWVEYDKRWYYCDDCGRVSAQGKIDMVTGQYLELDMFCPNGIEMTLSLLDMDIDRDWLESNLTMLCRKHCLP